MLCCCPGPDSNLIVGDSSSSSDSNHTSMPVLKSLFYDGAQWPSGSRQPCKDGSALSGCAIIKLNSSSSLDNSLTLEIYPGSLDMQGSDGEPQPESRTNGSTKHQSNLLLLHQVEPVQTPHSERSDRGHLSGLSLLMNALTYLLPWSGLSCYEWKCAPIFQNVTASFPQMCLLG